jgi:predicted DNA-binding transcriptional regulator AlpA
MEGRYNSTAPTLIDKREMLSLVIEDEPKLRVMEARGEFPKRIRIGRRVYWREAEVLAWLERQARQTTQRAAS